MNNQRAELLSRCCEIWGIGIFMILGMAAFWWFAFDIRYSTVSVALFDIYLLAMPMFIAFVGPYYLHAENPHAWLD